MFQTLAMGDGDGPEDNPAGLAMGVGVEGPVSAADSGLVNLRRRPVSRLVVGGGHADFQE